MFNLYIVYNENMTSYSFMMTYKTKPPVTIGGKPRDKKKWEIIEEEEKNKHRTISLDAIVEPINNSIKKKCRAKTLSGKPCPFKASCGEFCKRHTE